MKCNPMAYTISDTARMCALHPSLLRAVLLSGDVTFDAESIAVGLSRHLASSEAPLMAAAAELVEDLGVIFAGQIWQMVDVDV